MGYSMGSFVLSLACAVETRLHACVLAGGGNLTGPDGYWDRSKPMCQGLPYKALSLLGDRPAVLYALHAERGPTLVYNGLQDTTVAIPTHGPEFFEDMWKRAAKVHGGTEGLFEYKFDTGAHRPWFVTRPVARWFEKQLDFPNWTDADIARLPVTHISEWAAKNKVDMDRLYVTEEREGGAMAIGTGVPGLSRRDLASSAMPSGKGKRITSFTRPG